MDAHTNRDWEDLNERRERRFLLVLVALLTFAAFLIVRPYLGWTLFALFLGYVLFPVREALRRVKVPRWLAAGIGTLLGTAIVIGPFAFIAWQLTDELASFASVLSESGPDFFLTRLLVTLGVPSSMQGEIIGALEAALSASATQLVSALGNVAAGSLLAVFLLYAVLADGDRLVRWLRASTPLSEGRRELLFAEAKRGLDAIVFGVVAVALVQGATAAVGWWAFGLPEPIFWGFVLIVSSLIPYVGAYIVLFPAVVWLFATGDVTRAVGFLLFAVLVVGLVDNVVRPILIGRRGGIHPAVVLVGVLGGVPAFGPMGIVVGPLVLALFLAALTVLRRPERAEEEGRRIIEEEEEAEAGAEDE